MRQCQKCFTLLGIMYVPGITEVVGFTPEEWDQQTSPLYDYAKQGEVLYARGTELIYYLNLLDAKIKKQNG